MSHYHNEPFISNELFLFYSDIQLIDKYDEYTLNVMTNVALYKNLNKSKIVIFVKTDHLLHYIDFLLNFVKDYILITHCNDDYCVPFMNYPATNEINISHIRLFQCKKLKMWYTKNPCICHPKLKPIPIGPKWNWHSNRFFGENITLHKSIFTKYGINGYNEFKTGIKTRLLYCNFEVKNTNNPFIECHKNIRMVWKQYIKSIFPWNETKEFEEYIIELSTYKFCLCPPGRGIDTHRAWEALMVGTIPIVLSTPLDSLFQTLPVIIIDSIEVITEAFLNEKYKEIRSKKYDFSIVYSDYWKSLLTK